MIKTSHLTKYFGEFRAVDDASFEIGQGECVGLLGLNGAGKTTLLRMLTCLLTPSSGLASIDGLEVGEGSIEVRRRIGFLPEIPPLYGEMQVGRFLAFVARLRGVERAEVDARVGQAIERCRLSMVVEQLIETLSYGFKKRVGIAQAIVHDPPLVVLDEPIAGLDPAQIVEMRQLVRELRGSHTVLLSSHILSEISQNCDRLLVMHRGRIAAQGAEEELLGSVIRKKRVRVRLAGDQAEAEQALGSIEGIGSTKPAGESNGSFTLEITSDGDVRQEVARALVQAGLGLLELIEVTDDLESVFLKLTGTLEEEQ